MVRTIILLFLLGFSTALFSQTRENTWYKGNVELLNGKKLTGEINYNLRYQMVMIKIGESTEAFQEDQIKSMLLKNEDFSHDFRLVAYKDKNKAVNTFLVELLYQSPENYSLFKRYQAKTEEVFVNHDNLGTTSKDLKPDLDKDSFTSSESPSERLTSYGLLLNYEGDLVNLNRKSLFKTLDDRKKDVKSFIKKHDLEWFIEEDLIRILEFYDSIKN